MIATGALTLIFGKHGNERFLGRLFANVVGAGAEQVSRCAAISNLS